MRLYTVAPSAPGSGLNTNTPRRVMFAASNTPATARWSMAA
jgi:hypothetical protein